MASKGLKVSYEISLSIYDVIMLEHSYKNVKIIKIMISSYIVEGCLRYRFSECRSMCAVEELTTMLQSV